MDVLMASTSDQPTAPDHAGESPPTPDNEWQPVTPADQVQQTMVQQATGWKQARNKIMDQLIAEGVPPKRAARVAEATIRRAQAIEGHTVFHYADVEEEFESRALQAGADPRRIEAGKRRVWTAARATAESKGVEVEEALFFCYHESLDVQSDFLVAVAPEEEPADGAGNDGPERARRRA